MSDNNNNTPAPAPSPAPASAPAPQPKNPYDEGNWVEDPKAKAPEPPINNPANPPAPAPPAPALAPPVPNDEEIFDADAYLKEQAGVESWDVLKAQLKELNTLRENAKTPAEFKFANETTEKIIKALNQGDRKPLYSYLDKEMKINNAKTLDVSTISHAADILRLSYHLENDDLSADDIDFMIRRKFATPPKPIQPVEMSDPEYQEVLSNWQAQVKDIERGMIIEAKLAKPKLVQYESQLVIPEIKKPEPAGPTPPTQEELDAWKADQQRFLANTAAGIANLKEFKTQVKDEEVELPVSYIVSDDERAKTKAIAESLFTNFDYFIERWKSSDGVSLDEAKLVEDITWLENRQKIIQKIANESAAKRMAHKVTASKNPSILPNQGNGNGHLTVVDFDKQQKDYIMANS